MSRLPFLGLVLAVLPAVALADVAIPNTPAGRAFSAWLESFNRGDDSRWRADTGGYDLLEVYADDKTNVFFRVRARTHSAEEIGRLRVNEGDPVVVEELVTWRVPAGTSLKAVPLDAKVRRKVVEGVAAAFGSAYVYPEIGKKVAAAVREQERHGEYRSIRYGVDLARRLTHDLREISHDKHAEVLFSFGLGRVEPPPLTAGNCGFRKAEHLRPNIGYVKFDLFADTAICGPTASAAMNFVADSDALIFDLRDNHGGGGDMAEFIASYLFEQRTHFDDTVDREGNVTDETWTLPAVPGRKFLGKPVLVLTSAQTFSAAEDFSYNLRNLQRATLVGETTGGGAHPTRLEPIDEHFSVAVPFARSRSPITHTNWEGTGVEPDVKVPADQALDAALKLAIEATAKSGQ
jgi:hypothetical protein